jgi:hypothetical protein
MRDVHPALRPVKPSECALALAIPLTREEFLADLSRLDEKDFVHHFVAERGLRRAEPEFCWEVYQADEAVLVEATCLEVERLGVTVLHKARPADLTDLLRRFPVVTLVAHWRFVPVTPEDILNAPCILERLQSPQSDIHRAIRQAFDDLDPQLLRAETSLQLRDVELRDRVAAVIGKTAEEAERFYWDPTASVSFDFERARDGCTNRLTRLEFEYAFSGHIAQARVVEFHDGLRTAQELVEAIPENFRGLLDLTVCNSVIPAAPIRAVRRGCVVAANRRPAELGARIYLYGLEVSLLSRHTLSFVGAIDRVHRRRPVKTKVRKLWKLFAKFFNSIRGRR